VRRVDCAACGLVKRERLAFLADNPFYTKRFAMYVGRRCASSSVKSVAAELRLDWHAVKDLDKQYMRAQLRRAGKPSPTVIGVDEVSVRKGHDYRIVVSDLVRRRPIAFIGPDRSEASMDKFYGEMGPEKCAKIRLAAMDMWKPFRKSALTHAPQAGILYDKFHVLRHLGDAMDDVRRSEYKRLAGDGRKFIKGQRYALLGHADGLSPDARKSLKALLAANRRLNTAYVLREQFARLWDYRSDAWARKFFENWKSQLRWQRLPSFEKFARLVESHWDGISVYCSPEFKDIPLGFVEGLNTKIRTIQRRAYGLRDEEYMRLKILTCMLPEPGERRKIPKKA
jgi:transposase